MSKRTTPRRFGEKLHELRTRHSLTLKGLAQAIGRTAHGHISELEAGKKPPSIDFVISIADLFHISTDQLLRDELELGKSSLDPKHKKELK